jgi:voltage-dependent anion channel protein 2
LLGKDYHFHGTTLEVKTNTPSGTAFRVTGFRDSKSSAINGDIEAKYTNKANGLVFTQAWTTANVLRSQIELENYMAKGLKLDLTTGLNPEKNIKSSMLAATYKQPGLHGRAFLDVFKVRTRSYIHAIEFIS